MVHFLSSHNRRSGHEIPSVLSHGSFETSYSVVPAEGKRRTAAAWQSGKRRVFYKVDSTQLATDSLSSPRNDDDLKKLKHEEIIKSYINKQSDDDFLESIENIDVDYDFDEEFAGRYFANQTFEEMDDAENENETETKSAASSELTEKRSSRSLLKSFFRLKRSSTGKTLPAHTPVASTDSTISNNENKHVRFAMDVVFEKERQTAK